jgi:hypothetical protein
MDLPAPKNTKRRWTRLVLRALFGMATLGLIGSAWLTWEIQNERQRVVTLASIKARGGNYLWAGQRRASIPRTILRHLLGYRSIGGVLIPGATTDDELHRLECMFPEAEIWSRLSAKGEEPISMKALRIP